MNKLRVLMEQPPPARGDAEQQVAELRTYISRMVEELQFLFEHMDARATDYDPFDSGLLARNTQDAIDELTEGVHNVPTPYPNNPAMDGTAYPGASNSYARGDHVHPTDTSRAAAEDLSNHVGNTGNPHGVTKAQVGLTNVANERQYSALNPPPTDTSRAAAEDLSNHVGNTGNPHGVTKAQVGLTNVANERQYSALNPPPTPSAADVGAIPATEKGVASGVASLGSDGKVPSGQLPAIPAQATVTPLMDGLGYVGDSAKYAKEDHVHPKDTSKANFDTEILVVNLGTVSSLPKTVSNAKITADHVVIQAELGTPAAQTGNWTVTTSTGSVTLSGAISGSTTVTLVLGNSGGTVS